jgi:hypothetical protein
MVMTGNNEPHFEIPEHQPDPKIRWILLAIPVCIFMSIFELDRALGGNTRSWAYVPEWAIFAGFILYMNKKFSEPQEPFDDSHDPKREID